jgi:hypothetical protein
MQPKHKEQVATKNKNLAANGSKKKGQKKQSCGNATPIKTKEKRGKKIMCLWHITHKKQIKIHSKWHHALKKIKDCRHFFILIKLKKWLGFYFF